VCSSDLLEEKKLMSEFFSQFDELREEILPRIGLVNNYLVTGFEGDDLIASICKNNSGVFVIVTSDEDMYQLLDDRIHIYDLRKKQDYTTDNFLTDYNIPVSEWVYVKATAGCITDNVKGIEGVGEKTVIKYINKELKETTKAYQAIKNGMATIDRNYQLVILPLAGTPIIKLKEQKINITELVRVFNDNGMKSHINKIEQWRKLI
jgi:5'-3' exonuclease